MIDTRLEKIIEQLRVVKMSTDEKSEVLNHTLSVIEKIEAISMIPDDYTAPIKSPYHTFTKILVSLHYKKFAPAFLVAIFLVGAGGVSLAAENTLPGDSLYGVKKINEQVLSYVAFSPEAKAQLALEASERRLQEATTLSARGELNNEVKASLQQDFKKQATLVKNQVASLISENNIDAAQEITVNFESTLKAHEELLAKVSENPENLDVGETTQVTSLLATVRDEIATTTVSRVNLQRKEIVDAGNSDSKLLARLLEVTNKLQTLKDLKDQAILVSASGAVATDENISIASSSLAKARGYIEQRKFNEAFIVVQQASRAISDAKSTIVAENKAGGDVKRALVTTDNATAAATASVSAPAATTSTVSATTTPTETASTTIKSSATTTEPVTLPTLSTPENKLKI